MSTVSAPPADFHSFMSDVDGQLARERSDDDLRNSIDAAHARLLAAVPNFDGSIRRSSGYRCHPTEGRTWQDYYAVNVFLEVGHVTGTGDTLDAAVEDAIAKLSTLAVAA